MQIAPYENKTLEPFSRVYVRFPVYADRNGTRGRTIYLPVAGAMLAPYRLDR